MGAISAPHRAPLNAAGAAEYLGVPERFVKRLRFERRIPSIKIGKYVRYSPDDLDAFIEECREPCLN